MKEPTIRKEYKPTEAEHDEIRQVYQRKREMGDRRADFEPLWDKWEKAWEGYRTPKNADDWTSDIYIPITTATIESMMSEIVNQELMPIAVERGAEDQPKAVVINNAIEYSWDLAKSDVTMHEIIHDALVFGTGIGQEYYWQQPRKIKVADGKGKYTEKEVLEYDDCYLERVSLRDFYVDEKARAFFGPYGARDCIRRYIMHIDDFKAFFKGKTWDPEGRAKYVKPGGDTNYYEFYQPPQSLDHSKEVEVLWYWNKPEDKLVIVANDVRVKSGPNPYKHKQLPFARAVDIKRTSQFYGKGEAELLESMQEEVNTLRRMIIDRNHLDIDKPILVSDTLTIEDEDVIARPHGVIPVGDVNAAKPMEYGDIPSSVFKSLEMMIDDRIRVTGMDERQMSVSSAGTATEAAILKESTLKRLNMKINQIKSDFLVDVGRLRVANILQFYSQPKLEKIVGEKGGEEYRSKVMQAAQNGTLVSEGGTDYQAQYRNLRLKDKALSVQNGIVSEQPAKGYTFFTLKPEFFLPTHGGYDIRYKATSTIPVSKPLKQQKDLEMYDRLIQNPAVDPWKLASMLLESHEYDADEFKMQAQGEQPGGSQTQDMQKLVDLAGVENSEMMQGKEIGPTPYSAPFHTEIHIEFMKSPRFLEEAPPESNILDIFKQHIEGELQAQQARGEVSGGMEGMEMGPGGPAGTPAAFGNADAQGQNREMAATMPGRAQGGGEMPRGMRGAETGIQIGRKL